MPGIFYGLFFLFLGICGADREMTPEQAAAFKKMPWNNANFEPEPYYYQPHCTFFKCPEEYACVRYGNGKAFFSVPEGCMALDKMCHPGEVG